MDESSAFAHTDVSNSPVFDAVRYQQESRHVVFGDKISGRLNLGNVGGVVGFETPSHLQPHEFGARASA